MLALCVVPGHSCASSMQAHRGRKYLHLIYTSWTQGMLAIMELRYHGGHMSVMPLPETIPTERGHVAASRGMHA